MEDLLIAFDIHWQTQLQFSFGFSDTFPTCPVNVLKLILQSCSCFHLLFIHKISYDFPVDTRKTLGTSVCLSPWTVPALGGFCLQDLPDFLGTFAFHQLPPTCFLSKLQSGLLNSSVYSATVLPYSFITLNSIVTWPLQTGLSPITTSPDNYSLRVTSRSSCVTCLAHSVSLSRIHP